MQIKSLFESDVTRDIPPVVYFHEQSPPKLADEVGEYIITGGWPAEHPNKKRVPNGIHEGYVRLLNAIVTELKKPHGPDLPNIWISGFYGSGKSSFAKLLGMALDGVALADGTSLSEVWLNRNTSPLRQQMVDAWKSLRSTIDPIAVVFDVGGAAKDNEHVHATVIRQVQARLGYCSTDANVADAELDIERKGDWTKFLKTAQEALGAPWSERVTDPFAEDHFSLIMHRMYPDLFIDPMSWFTSRAGTHRRNESPSDAVTAIRDMIRFRKPGSTLFLVIDEVSQYIVWNKDRIDRLRAFVTELGTQLKGYAWLIAIGQQQIDQGADDTFLVWLKDRFPEKLRVHLAPTNIRDVVHKRLLKKNRKGEDTLAALFEKHRPDLKLYAYGCENVSAEEFVEVYPMVPGQIDMLLQITSALRTRSGRSQGDDQAIRGLLQLLGELFRAQKLADLEVLSLVTLDQVYDVQQSALDSDVQNSMARVMEQCRNEANPLLIRAAKAVAMLELIQETEPTTAKLVSQCLFDRMDRGNQVDAVAEALEELRRRNLLGYSEKQGYKIQSSAGEEWERDRREIPVPRDERCNLIMEALKHLLAEPERPKLKGRPFQWAGNFSDDRRIQDVRLLDPRDDAVVRVDFRFLTKSERTESLWIKQSDETFLKDRIVWISGDNDAAEEAARDLAQSKGMVARYGVRKESLPKPKQLLLQDEEHRSEELLEKLHEAIAEAWTSGVIYFRGAVIENRDNTRSFSKRLTNASIEVLPKLFHAFDATTLTQSEWMPLLDKDLTGPSTKLLPNELGILELDGGKYVASCAGSIPQRILTQIETEQGLSGGNLLSVFGGPPYAYAPDVIKACVAGLLRGNKIKIQTDAGLDIQATRDAGARDVFDKDREFRKASIFPMGESEIPPTDRARICKFFEEQLAEKLDRENAEIADAVMRRFPDVARRLRETLSQHDQLPDRREHPAPLLKLQEALERCLRNIRETVPTVRAVKKDLEALRDGIKLLNVLHAELTADAVKSVRAAALVRDHELAQLRQADALPGEQKESADLITSHLEANRPWREISVLQQSLKDIQQAYQAERSRILEWQGQQIEVARKKLRQRDGFSTLTSEKSHGLFKILEGAADNTTPAAIAPALSQLQDPFILRLQRAEVEANEKLDKLLSEGDKPLIVPMDLSLHNREIKTEADVDALVNEIRERLMQQVKSGQRVRLL